MPEISKRFAGLPGYPFAGMAERRRALELRGVDVIDLGAGDADLDPPEVVVEALRRAAGDRSLDRYAFQLGLPRLREAIAEFMQSRFGKKVDPFANVLPLIGSKEGIAHLPQVFIDPGDTAVLPDPGYQAYRGGVLLAGGVPHAVPLRPENDFLIPLDEIPGDVLDRLKLLYLNYPNNPTAATAPDSYYDEAIAFCRRTDALLIHDNAYSEIAFGGYRPRSVFEFEGAWEHAIEFHSFSKTFNMTGWRLGWAVGNADLISALSKVKSFTDTGAYLGIQEAGVAALETHASWVPENVGRFEARRDAAVEAFRAAGFEVEVPRATMYLWIPVPGDEGSQAFAARVLDETGVIVLPGGALGVGGEGFFRVALTVTEDRLAEAARRLGEILS